MKKLNILFALTNSPDKKVEEAILDSYINKYNDPFEYEKAYYLQGIAKSLSEEDYDIVVINEKLESEPVSLAFMDMLTDNYSDVRYILVLDEKHREDGFTKNLYAMSCYDCLFQSDLNVHKLSDLINKPRKKKAAKIYYGIDEKLDVLEEVVNVTGFSQIPDDEIGTVLDNFNKATEDDIEELFDLAIKTYSFQQIVGLISILHDDVKNIMKKAGCKIDEYEKEFNKELRRVSAKEKVKVVEKVVKEVVEKIVEKEVPVYIEGPAPEPQIIEKEVIKEVEKEVIKEVEVVKEVFTTPNDYKKVIAVIGAGRRNGTTTLVEILASTYSKEKKNVGIIDFSFNKDLFEKYIFNSEDLCEPLQDILRGIDEPYKINKRCSLYTASIQNSYDVEADEMLKVIDTVKNSNDIVFLDLDLEDLPKVYAILDKILIVISQDITNAKYFSSTFSEMLSNKDLVNKESKMQFVVNMHLKDNKVLNDKDLVECYLYKVNDYLDTSLNEKIMKNSLPILRVGFDENILLSSYRGEEIILNEEGSDNVYSICENIYPLTKREKAKESKPGKFSGFFKRK